MVIYLAVALIVVVILFTIAFYFQEKNYKELLNNYEDALNSWNASIDRYQAGLKEKSDRIEKLEKEKRDDKQGYWVTINELEFENKKLKEIIEKHEKEENVSHETSYNQSFGLPEAIDYFDQQYAREDTNRG